MSHTNGMFKPNTKSRFWSKKNLKRKLEFWSEKEDVGVFGIADFKFLGLEARFERNWRKWFWNLENQISGPKIQNRNRIWGFEVPISNFLKPKFWIFGIDFEFLSQKLQIKIEFQVFVSRFRNIPKTQFSQNWNFQILAESNSAFSSNFDPKFLIFRV